jgi:dihydroorotate dehydrogenase (NAD+) catalytic subunit
LSRSTPRLRRRSRRGTGPEVDLSVRLGALALANPIVAASGTFGHGAEFAHACPPHELGAVTVKSLAHFAHAGNPPLRVTETPGGGMLNSVGLAGPGVSGWIENDLPALEFFDARVIVSLWGRVVDDYAKAAAMLAPVSSRIAGVEVNLSCPNLGGHEMFAQSVEATADAVRAVVGELRGAPGAPPVFAKLTAQVTDVVIIAQAALGAGATGLTLINTLPGLIVDLDHRRPMLGAGGGGLSGPPILPVALRTVADVARAHPGVPIIGTGGVSTGEDAVAMLLAGASAVGVGTATFADARATLHVRDELIEWCVRHRVERVAELIGRLQWPT